MIFRRHIPDLPIGKFVAWFWYYDHLFPDHTLEHVLPDGTFELVINLRDESRKLFGHGNRAGYESFQGSWISGTHSQYIVIDALPNSSMIGVHFKPGGVGPVLGIPAENLSNRVVELEAIWGLQARELREQLLTAVGPENKFRLLENFLVYRLSKARTMAASQRVSWAVQQILSQPDLPKVGKLADSAGVSHKHFIEEFRREVGLTPKLFCRIQRFQKVLANARAGARVQWADVAYRCGYFDQSHFVNDFQSFSGLTPSGFLERRQDDPNFVPVG